MKPYFKSARCKNDGIPDYRSKKKILDYINKMFIEPANTYLEKYGNICHINKRIYDNASDFTITSHFRTENKQA